MEKKYHELRQPLYSQRNAIIAGKAEVEATVPVGNGDTAIGVPGFWLQCIRTHPTIGGLVAAEDCPALEALCDIQCEYNEDWTGFKLIFSFSENDFFTNKVRSCKFCDYLPSRF